MIDAYRDVLMLKSGTRVRHVLTGSLGTVVEPLKPCTTAHHAAMVKVKWDDAAPGSTGSPTFVVRVKAVDADE